MPADVFAFGPFELDTASRQLTRQGAVLQVSPRQFDLLHLLVARAGTLLSKDALIEAAWQGVAVTDNSVEQAISSLRRLLAEAGDSAYIETQARRGYRFVASVKRVERRAAEEDLEALLAPHRAFLEGRAALETLERTQIVHAREVFARMVEQVPDQPAAHVGLANACVMQFEMTRSDPAPDVASLALAATHARDACRLNPQFGEAWATLGIVLDRMGNQADSLAASRMATSLEPDNWRHHLRLAYVSWGEERLRAARRGLTLLPGFPLGHWLAATVHVAREAFDDAERELATGRASIDAAPASSRFSSVALDWLAGLLRLRVGDTRGAMEAFDRELANEPRGQLYARECCANVWYAIGALRIREGRIDEAKQAFAESLSRVAGHPFATASLGGLLGIPASAAPPEATARVSKADLAMASAVNAVVRGDTAAAVHIIEDALDYVPPGSGLWLLPIEPTLGVGTDPVWARALARLRHRAV